MMEVVHLGPLTNESAVVALTAFVLDGHPLDLLPPLLDCFYATLLTIKPFASCFFGVVTQTVFLAFL